MKISMRFVDRSIKFNGTIDSKMYFGPDQWNMHEREKRSAVFKEGDVMNYLGARLAGTRYNGWMAVMHEDYVCGYKFRSDWGLFQVS